MSAAAERSRLAPRRGAVVDERSATACTHREQQARRSDSSEPRASHKPKAKPFRAQIKTSPRPSRKPQESNIMSQQTTAAATSKEPKSADIIIRDERGTGIAERLAKAGDVIELPREEAEKLAGRKFEGYGTVRQENGGVTCAPMPSPTGGLVKDPIVQIIGE
jgi:hypothetical protein